jgi:hypothetical protein
VAGLIGFGENRTDERAKAGERSESRSRRCLAEGRGLLRGSVELGMELGSWANHPRRAEGGRRRTNPNAIGFELHRVDPTGFSGRAEDDDAIL